MKIFFCRYLVNLLLHRWKFFLNTLFNSYAAVKAPPWPSTTTNHRSEPHRSTTPLQDLYENGNYARMPYIREWSEPSKNGPHKGWCGSHHHMTTLLSVLSIQWWFHVAYLSWVLYRQDCLGAVAVSPHHQPDEKIFNCFSRRVPVLFLSRKERWEMLQSDSTERARVRKLAREEVSKRAVHFCSWTSVQVLAKKTRGPLFHMSFQTLPQSLAKRVPNPYGDFAQKQEHKLVKASSEVRLWLVLARRNNWFGTIQDLEKKKKCWRMNRCISQCTAESIVGLALGRNSLSINGIFSNIVAPFFTKIDFPMRHYGEGR